MVRGLWIAFGPALLVRLWGLGGKARGRYIFEGVDFALRGRVLGIGSGLVSDRKGRGAGSWDWEGS